MPTLAPGHALSIIQWSQRNCRQKEAVENDCQEFIFLPGFYGHSAIIIIIVVVVGIGIQPAQEQEQLEGLWGSV